MFFPRSENYALHSRRNSKVAYSPPCRSLHVAKHCDVVAADIDSGAFDPRDITRLDNDDKYAACFLRTMKAKGDVEEAVKLIPDTFKFRKEYGVNGTTKRSTKDKESASHTFLHQI
jgi:hypothetical protein